MRERTFIRSDRGSLLLESVVVMPLHLLALFGAMWIGALGVNRNRLVELDRMNAVDKGNRFVAVAPGAEATRLNNLVNLMYSTGDGVTVEDMPVSNPSSTAPNNQWWQHNTSRLVATHSVPNWLAGISAVAEMVAPSASTESTSFFEGTRKFAAQGQAEGAAAMPATATSISRNGAYQLSRRDALTLDGCAALAREPFADGTVVEFSTSVGVEMEPLSTYTRNATMQEWGRF